MDSRTWTLKHWSLVLTSCRWSTLLISLYSSNPACCILLTIQWPNGNTKFHVSDVLFDCTLSSCLETLQRCAATQVLDILHSFRDVQHLGTWHLVDLCTHVQSHYPGCVEKLFMVNVPLIFNGVWKVASPFIKDAVRKKVGDWIWAFTPKSSQKKTLNLWNQIASCMRQIQSLISVEGIQPLQSTTSTSISISNLIMRLKFTVYLPDYRLSGLMLLCR